MNVPDVEVVVKPLPTHHKLTITPTRITLKVDPSVEAGRIDALKAMSQAIWKTYTEQGLTESLRGSIFLGSLEEMPWVRLARQNATLNKYVYFTPAGEFLKATEYERYQQDEHVQG